MNEMRFPADKPTYIQTQIRWAVIASAAAMGVLWVIGDPNVWVGAVAGVAGIGVRGWYLASEELAAVWEIKSDTLSGPGPRHVKLDEIQMVRSLGNMVQIITTGGDKHLIKHQEDPAHTIERIEIARARGRA